MNSASLQFGFSSPCLGNILSQHEPTNIKEELTTKKFSSPCLENVLSRSIEDIPYGKGYKMLFSSPCLGNVLSQQVWEIRLPWFSVRIYRRGFPEQLDFHYYLPLTFHFFSLYAYRRGLVSRPAICAQLLSSVETLYYFIIQIIIRPWNISPHN